MRQQTSARLTPKIILAPHSPWMAGSSRPASGSGLLSKSRRPREPLPDEPKTYSAGEPPPATHARRWAETSSRELGNNPEWEAILFRPQLSASKCDREFGPDDL